MRLPRKSQKKKPLEEQNIWHYCIAQPWGGGEGGGGDFHTSGAWGCATFLNSICASIFDKKFGKRLVNFPGKFQNRLRILEEIQSRDGFSEDMTSYW